MATRVAWSWADSRLGDSNPLRWSSSRSVDETLNDLRAREQLRPVTLRLVYCHGQAAAVAPQECNTDFGGERMATEERFASTAGAVARLEQLVTDSTEGPAVPFLASSATGVLSNQPRLSHTIRSFSVPFDGIPPDALVFKGGGTKGIVYTGVVKRLEQAGMMDGISQFAGSSAGSQVAAMLAFGFTGDELERVMATAPWEQLLDCSGRCYLDCRNVYRLFKEFGLCKGDFLQNYLDSLFAQKCDGQRLVTFSQLWELKGRDLRLGACNTTTKKFEFLDRHSHPHMPVCVAARASSAIPFVFRPVKWAEDLFIDGGLEGNLPITAFGHTRKTLAFNLVSSEAGSRRGKPETFWSFVMCAMEMLKESSQSHFGLDQFGANGKALHKAGIDVININTGEYGGLDTDMSDEEIQTLIQAGNDAVEHYLSAAGMS